MKINFNNLVLGVVVFATALSAQTISLNSGWNLIGINEKPSSEQYWPLTLISSNSNINTVFGDGQTYVLGATRGNNLIGLEPSKGYWINATSSTSVELASGTASNMLSDISFSSIGWYLVSYETSSTISAFINVMNNIGLTAGTFFGDGETYIVGATRGNNLSNIVPGKGYWINISAINFDVFIQNAITADPDLTSYTTTNLNNKSVLVMENNSGALKTSLITFSSDQTYKEVEVSNFSASTLNGSDADINATVSSAVSSLTTGVCGNWNFDGTDLNMTPSDGTTTGTTVQISDSSDGNFTIGSTYKKVVYYGAAIDLSNVTDCQLDSFLLPPSVPN